jgi:hypothetical protein
VLQAAQSGRGHFGAGPLQAQEQHLLLQYGPLWADAIEQAVLTDVLLTLTGEGPRVGKQVLASLLDPLGRGDNSRGGLDAALVDPAWQKPLCAWAEQLVLASDDFLTAQNDLGNWRVPKPRLNVEARLAALRLMAPEVFHISNWGHRAREALLQQLLDRLFLLIDPELLAQMSHGNGVLRMVGTGGLEELLQLHAVPEPLRIWALDELRIIQALMVVNATKRLPQETASPMQLF